MKKFFGLFVTAFVLAFSSVASAQNAHWILDEVACDVTGSPISCDFKIAGLGRNVDGITVTLSVDVEIEFGCQNPGEQFPPAYQGLLTTLSASNTFFSGRNGQVSGTLSVIGNVTTVPSASDVCPAANWTVVNVNVLGGGGITLSATGLPDIVM